MKSPGQELYEQLRRKHPVFGYEGFSCMVIDNELHVVFDFSLGEKISFRPTHKFAIPKNFTKKMLSDSLFRNLIFNLGMAELVSYWKAACSPDVIIKAAKLSVGQVTFWKNLYLYGLSEFFYVNGISPLDDFITIRSSGTEIFEKAAINKSQRDKILVPVGGGKDSVVTIELLSLNRNCVPYIMNPRPASLQSAVNAGYGMEEVLVSYRSIDSKLIELNARGYLNGHTPFSAVLAFTACIIAYINKISEIALSNESSANEPTIPGTRINHQYSKSLEFENDFRAYLLEYITDDIDYYSYLRPLNEVQIARLFASYPAHHESFRSCNVGSKANAWCGACPKCLFTFIILSPFMEHDRLVHIFGKDLFFDRSLTGLLDQLSGVADEKPFECIGTIDEVNTVLSHLVISYGDHELPPLLQHYATTKMLRRDAGYALTSLLLEFGPHNIPSLPEIDTLKSALHDR